MKFRYVMFRKRELEQNGQYVAGVQNLLKQLRKNRIAAYILENETKEQLQKIMQKKHLASEEGLIIAATDSTIQLAAELNLAIIAYENQAFSQEERYGAPILIQDLNEADVTLLERWWRRKHGLPWIILETKRCYLRELALSDLDDLYALYATEGMTDYIEPLYERKEEEAYQRAYIENMYGFYGYGMWMIYEKRTDRLIGRAGLEHREIGNEIELEMGYAITKSHQNRGIATEICQAILAYAKGHLEYQQVNCLIQKENLPSIALVRKLGFCKQESISERGKNYERYVYIFK